MECYITDQRDGVVVLQPLETGVTHSMQCGYNHKACQE